MVSIPPQKRILMTRTCLGWRGDPFVPAFGSFPWFASERSRSSSSPHPESNRSLVRTKDARCPLKRYKGVVPAPGLEPGSQPSEGQ